ncbi:MAG TPA: M48 family metallopeptidase [Chitinophagaceae bacterium]
MRLTTLALLFISLVFTACSGNDRRHRKADSYSFSCLDSALGGSRVNKTLDKAGSVLRDLTVDENSITDEIQNDYGEAFHQDVLETGTFRLNNNPAINRDLRTVMDELLEMRDDPTDIRYFIYAVEDTMINAFTFGGRIYVTTGMYEKCGGKTPLLYAIVGHEIGHSELGHIRKTIQEMMVAEKIFGEDNAASALQITKMLTGSFNQRNELEADYYGTDLTNSLNYDVCAAVKFWKQMSEMENEYNTLEDFFRTHPFSALRAECLQAHIRRNFHRECE